MRTWNDWYQRIALLIAFCTSDLEIGLRARDRVKVRVLRRRIRELTRRFNVAWEHARRDAARQLARHAKVVRA